MDMTRRWVWCTTEVNNETQLTGHPNFGTAAAKRQHLVCKTRCSISGRATSMATGAKTGGNWPSLMSVSGHVHSIQHDKTTSFTLEISRKASGGGKPDDDARGRREYRMERGVGRAQGECRQ